MTDRSPGGIPTYILEAREIGRNIPPNLQKEAKALKKKDYNRQDFENLREKIAQSGIPLTGEELSKYIYLGLS